MASDAMNLAQLDASLKASTDTAIEPTSDANGEAEASAEPSLDLAEDSVTGQLPLWEEKLRLLFTVLDTSESGYVTEDEFSAAFKDPSEAENLWKRYKDDTGKLNEKFIVKSWESVRDQQNLNP